MSQVYHVLDNKEHHVTYNWNIINVTGLSRVGQQETLGHV